MAEACGLCCKSFLHNRKINESLKCACERPFFSQIVARNNVPTDEDCWIEVPKRFVRRYVSMFGETVNLEGEDDRLYSSEFVGSDKFSVGYGFEWYGFASSHKICLGDQVVFTLMEGSHFLVQVHRAHVKVKVEVEHDVDVQVAGAQDWLLAKAKRSGRNTSDQAPHVDIRPSETAPIPTVVYTKRNGKVRKSGGVHMLQKEKTVGMSSVSCPIQAEALIEDISETEDVEASSFSTSDSDFSLGQRVLNTIKRSKQKSSMEDDSGATSMPHEHMTEEEELRSSSRRRRRVPPSIEEEIPWLPSLYVAPRVNKIHHWAQPGTTKKETYVSKRGPVTRDDRNKVFEVAKACQISHNSYLRQLEKDNCYRALLLAIPAPWWRENMPQTNDSFKATLVDEEGKSWQVRIHRMVMFWKHFTLDNHLEEDDVVVMELVDPRLESVKFRVHIFRVVDIQVTLTGKASWAAHYDIVDGIKKRKQQARSKGKGRLDRQHGEGSSLFSDSKRKTSRRVTRRQSDGAGVS